jgi:hypothetical protein
LIDFYASLTFFSKTQKLWSSGPGKIKSALPKVLAYY